MDRETVLHNIMLNYGKYGITEDMVEEVIDAGLEGGMSYDLIYWDICRKISEITGEEFVCTSSDMAHAFGVSEDEINRLIEEAREALIADGQNPDEYFKTVETARFMMQWRISAINDTKIKYIDALGKPYRVTKIDFFKLTLEASEMDGVDIYALPADEVFNVEEFEDFHVTLRNWTGKVVDFAEFLKNT